MARYRNTFHKPFDAASGPEFYETDVGPTEYKGFKIYQRFRGCFDVVLNELDDPRCITQRAGLNGAKRFIDAFWARENAA